MNSFKYTGNIRGAYNSGEHKVERVLKMEKEKFAERRF